MTYPRVLNPGPHLSPQLSSTPLSLQGDLGLSAEPGAMPCLVVSSSCWKCPARGQLLFKQIPLSENFHFMAWFRGNQN